MSKPDSDNQLTDVKSTGRNHMVSIAKGIGIVLMVIGHSGYGIVPINWFIYMFHMPLFVILSGYCFKEYYLDHRLLFVKRRIRRLYLPVLICGCVMLLLHNVLYSWGLYQPGTIEGSYYELKDILREFLNVLRFKFVDPMMGVAWFVRDLFVSSLIVIALSRLIAPRKWLWVAIFVAMAMIFHQFKLLSQEFYFTTWLFCALFCVGWILQRYWKPARWWVTALLFVFVAMLSYFAHGALIRVRIEVMIPYLVGAVAGSIMTMNVSAYLARHTSSWLHRGLVYLGDNTLIILMLHLLCFKLVTACIILCQGLSWEHLADYPVLKDHAWCWWIYVLVGLGLPLLVKATWKQLRTSAVKLIRRN